MADCMAAFFQPVHDRDALVEDEAGAVPEALIRRDGFQIFQYAALEVVNIFKTLREQSEILLMEVYAVNDSWRQLSARADARGSMSCESRT